MDKYTIDLDKVLNDFEYSELTEQNKGNGSNPPVYNYVDNKQKYSPTYPKIPTTKHSINNVFHSLNEYLNSDIKYDKPVDINEIVTSQNVLPHIDATNLNLPNHITLENTLNVISDNADNKNDKKPGKFEVKYDPNNMDYSLTYNKNPNGNQLKSNSNESITNYETNQNQIESFESIENYNGNKMESSNKLNFPTSASDMKDIKNIVVTDQECTNPGITNLGLINPGFTNKDYKPDQMVVQLEQINSGMANLDLISEHAIEFKPELIPDYETSENDPGVPNLGSIHPGFTNPVFSTPKDLGFHPELNSNSESNQESTQKLNSESDLGLNQESNDGLVNPGFETNDYYTSHMVESKLRVISKSSNFKSDNNVLLPDDTYSDSDSDLNPKPDEIKCNEIRNEIRNDLTKNTNPESYILRQMKDNNNKRNNESIKEDEVEKIVRFVDDLDLSDTEMENELAQLEEEYKEKIQAKNDENVETDVDNNVQSVSNRDSVEKIADDRDSSEKIEVLDDRGVEPVQDGVKIEVLHDRGDQSNPESVQVLENLEIEKPRKNRKKRNKNTVNTMKNDTNETGEVNKDLQNPSVVTDDGLESEEDKKISKQDTVDISEVDEVITITEQLNTIEINTERDVNVDRNNFALLRPNSLDLNPEVTPPPTDNKPINLIGNPGSTPYNNVYVENSLEPEENAQNTETETNNSLSPTVSEVSTSEVSDSLHTSDSCNDTSLDDNSNDKKKEEVSEQTEESTESTKRSSRRERQQARPILEGWLGRAAPFWIPDSDALNCQHCSFKFTVLKRRHHCRACGLVLCSKCCSMKFKLEYMDHAEARVCMKCYEILLRNIISSSSSSDGSAESQGASPVTTQNRPLNPGNPMEYCSVVPPLQQVGNVPVTPPSVMVPVGVLKRKGSGKSRGGKSVMFCDGIRPGCDLTELDYDFNYKESQSSRKSTQPQQKNRNLPKIDTKTGCYIPNEDNTLPPTVNVVKSEVSYTECANNQNVVEMLKNEQLTFAIQRNLHVHCKIISMDCCINKSAWSFATEGMISVGQDEIIILLEFIDNEKTVPKDIFLHLNNIYNEAVKGTSITEMGLSIHNTPNFLESKNHAGFLYVKPSFQCVQNVILPKEPYLIGILIHRWETPWAKIFPLRLLLRLGAEYRYYPSPIISTRHRESVYVEIGHTIINLLADFRNFSYTLPNVRGLTIHMKEKNTTVSIPINRYDQVMKALNNSSDHILAFAANFSPNADSHLVCIQDTHGNNENAYTTHAINIHNKPRKVTGASFIVLNGALKSSSGLTAKSSIVEDGLMIQILPEQMVKLRNSLRNMKDFKINCGCVNAQSDESVNIVWTGNDVNFNVGVVSPIDNTSLSGVPSIRVHNGKDYVCNSGNKMIRWTEVFIIQSGDENVKTQDPVDISKLSESISKATCQALVKYLDLLATNSFVKVGIRTTLHVENVSYLAGSNGVKLPPIYMKSLDNELIPILHKITQNNLGENAVVIELIFHILNM